MLFMLEIRCSARTARGGARFLDFRYSRSISRVRRVGSGSALSIRAMSFRIGCPLSLWTLKETTIGGRSYCTPVSRRTVRLLWPRPCKHVPNQVCHQHNAAAGDQAGRRFRTTDSSFTLTSGGKSRRNLLEVIEHLPKQPFS